MGIVNPYVLLALVALLIGSAGSGYYYGGKHKEDAMLAQMAKVAEVEARVRDAAIEGAAEAIAQIEIKNTTIRQKVEVQTREVPVYRECKHDPDVKRMLDDALQGPGAGSGTKGTGNDSVPKVDSP